MTPHAPISDHVDPTVPDGNDFPPPPLSPGPVSGICGGKAAGSAGAGWSTHRVRGHVGDEPPDPPSILYLFLLYSLLHK